MATLALLRPPASMRSGDDVLGQRTAEGLTRAGLSTELHELWPEWWAKHLWHSVLPYRRRLFDQFPARWNLRLLATRIQNCRAVWINGCSLPIDSNCAFEQSRVLAGQNLIFHLQDDWFSIPGAKQRAENAVRCANLIVVPTVALQERILTLFPQAKVITLEEPTDIHRFPQPMPQNHRVPFLVWTGNPNNLKELPGLSAMLEKLHRIVPFTLRIVSGQKKPRFDIAVPWEWHPHSQQNEGLLLAGAVAGLAPMEDTQYARCKGSYKVKTYLAAGIPSVASPVGHQEKMIQTGVTGFLVNSESQWLESLTGLLRNPSLAANMGLAARQFAVEHFSHEALMPKWAAILNTALGYEA